MKALQRFASIPKKIRAGEPTAYVCQQTQGYSTALESREKVAFTALGGC